ncbi:MAG: caspase family protein, partial [Bacteroidetes bacterium]|nr:caspase family protein [Bacteroidota bacterium]
MKKFRNVIILVIITVLFSNCTTPKHLIIPNAPFRSSIYNDRKINIKEFRVDPLTKQDFQSDIQKLMDVFSRYLQFNDSYYKIQKFYPDASISVSVTPSETIKRTWILDALFIYPCCLYWPYSPRWGQTKLDIKCAIDIPSVDYAEYSFHASKNYKIDWYPYYKAGKILTENFSHIYPEIFSQISEYDFLEKWPGKQNITALLESKEKTTISEQILAEESKNRPTVTVLKKISDVDENIPFNNISKPNTFALIIGNEDYRSYQLDLSSEVNVDFAEQDARTFKNYVIQTLGVPERNIIMLINGTSGQMHQALAKINLIARNTKGEAKLIFYYAGHGLPDEVTREPYLIPVDVSGKDLSQAIKLKDVYSKLTEHPNKQVTMFLDACFSGGARNQGLLAARAVKVKPKEQQLKGNLIVFTASSGEESS